jgi:ribosomal protein S18 acetylase RimI-like enzyme
MTIVLRSATRDDATHMAALVNLAGAGLPAAIWAGQADFGQDPLDVGRERIRGDDGNVTWQNGQMAEIGGHAAGVMISYQRTAEEQPLNSTAHPMFRPLIRLQNAAPNTHFLAIIAVYPQFQRQGVATKLMQMAEESPGTDGMSLIVAGGNSAGLNLFHKRGYAETMRLSQVRANLKTEGDDWVLMRKQ